MKQYLANKLLQLAIKLGAINDLSHYTVYDLKSLIDQARIVLEERLRKLK